VSLRNVDQQTTRNLVSLRIDTLTLSGDGSGLNMDQGNLILTGSTFAAVAAGVNAGHAFVNARSAGFKQQAKQTTNRGFREPAAAFDAANGGIFVGGVSDTSSATAPASRVVIPSVGVFGSNSTNFMEDIIPLPTRGAVVRHALISVNHASRGGGGGLVASEVEDPATGNVPSNALSFFSDQGAVRMEYGYVYVGGGVSLAAANGVTSVVNIGSPISPTPPNTDALSESISLTASTITVNANGQQAQIDMMPHSANGVGGIVLPYIAPNGATPLGPNLATGNVMCVTVNGFVGVCRQGGNEFAETQSCASNCGCGILTGGLCFGSPAVGSFSNVPGWQAGSSDPCECQLTH
jgi:hypothetical protein